MNEKALHLNARMPVGIGTERKITIIEHWDTFNGVEGTVISLGLGELHQPENECPNLTAEMLNEVNSSNFSNTQQWFASWLSFCTELQARVDAQVLQYENMLMVLTAETKKNYRDQHELAGSGKRLTVDELNQKLVLSSEYLSVKHSLQQLEQKKLLLRARVDTLDNSVRLLSRRIELAKIDISAQRHVDGANDRFARPRG